MTTMQELRISALLRAREQAAPHGTAFIQDGRTVGNAGFAELVNHCAGWLASRGIVRGDAVALWLVNSVEWLASAARKFATSWP
jgi:fatty-acyl-CoA synthase